MEPKRYRLEQHQIEAIQEAEELGLAENEPGAARLVIDEGAQSLGLNGHADPDTALRAVVRRAADSFAMFAIMTMAALYFMPVPTSARLLVVWPFATSVALYGIDRVLASYEPGLSARLPWGGKA